MSFWWREAAGWALVVIGLWIFLVCFQYLSATHIFEAWPAALVGIIVFRGGIHLLKVAVAARVCTQATGKKAG